MPVEFRPKLRARAEMCLAFDISFISCAKKFCPFALLRLAHPKIPLTRKLQHSNDLESIGIFGVGN
jgi:hypothetical protein